MSIEAELVKVHLVKSDIPLTPPPVTKAKIRTVASQVLVAGTAAGTQSYEVLALAPNRKCATLTVVGQSTDIVYLCTSKSNAQALNGAPLMGLQVVTVYGENEMHIGAAQGVSVAIGIIADYEGS